MTQPQSCLIHEFYPNDAPYFDYEGDVMLGSYYQFLDEDEQPVGSLVGPYRDGPAAEKAAKRAFKYNDF